MPGIISADIKSLNRGSLKEASIKIKCYNPRQFDIIDTLFIKLKYGMLLEWGHSIYVDNKGEVQNNNFNLSNEFLNVVPPESSEEEGDESSIKEGVDKQQAIYNQIKKYREESNGNYDAILAYVKNFNWTLNSDNSYDITLDLISIGDIIESLRMDVSLNVPKLGLQYEGNVLTSKDLAEYDMPLLKNANRSLLDQIFAGILVGTEQVDDYNNSWKDKTVILIDQLHHIVNHHPSSPNPYLDSLPKHLKEGLSGDREGSMWREIVRLEFDEISDGQEEAYYIKLGTLLRIIEQSFIPKINEFEYGSPMFRINNTFKRTTWGGEVDSAADEFNRVALCYTMPSQMSLDPSVCLIPLPEDTNSIRDFLETDIISKIKNANPTLTDAEAKEKLNDNIDTGNWFTGGWGKRC